MLTMAPAPLAFRYGRQALAQGMHIERDAEHIAPLLETHVFEGLLLPQRRVVDQIVDAAELLRASATIA